MIAIMPAEYGPDYSDKCGSFKRDPNANASVEDRCRTCVFEDSCLFAEAMMLIDLMWDLHYLREKPNPTGAMAAEFQKKCIACFWQRIHDFDASRPVHVDESSVNAPTDELYPSAEDSPTKGSQPEQKAPRGASKPKGKK